MAPFVSDVPELLRLFEQWILFPLLIYFTINVFMYCEILFPRFMDLIFARLQNKVINSLGHRGDIHVLFCLDAYGVDHA